MARIPIVILGILQMIWGFPAEAMPRAQRSASRATSHTLQRTVQRFTEAWIVAGDMQKAIAYTSPEAVHSPCLIDEVRQRNQSESQVTVREFLRKYLAERREEIVTTNAANSPSKNPRLEQFIEPLPIVNQASSGTSLAGAGQSTLFKPRKKAIQGLACNEKEGAWLLRLLSKSPIAVQAFRAKGAPEGRIMPVVLFWRKESAGWKILAVGTISQ